MDGFGKLEGPLEAYRTARAGHDALRRNRQQLLDATLARQRECALLEFERDELEAADPRTGEYDELMRQSHAMASAEAIRAAATEGYGLLYEADHSAQELLKRVARNLEPLAAAAPSWPTRPPAWRAWPVRRARWPTPCATWASSGRTIRGVSRRSRRAWRSIAGWPAGSIARPMPWPTAG